MFIESCESAPGLYLVLTPGQNFTIVAVSENQLRATMTRREAILGRGLFVLISDIGLPDGSGLDVMRHVKGRRQLKGIAISGFGMEDDLRRSREAGFEQHLTKPVNFQKLEAVIEQVAS